MEAIIAPISLHSLLQLEQQSSFWPVLNKELSGLKPHKISLNHEAILSFFLLLRRKNTEKKRDKENRVMGGELEEIFTMQPP